MKKIATLSLSLVVMAVTLFVFFTATPKAQAAEAGTLSANPIVLSNDILHTKYWTSSNYDLNCYNKIVVPSRGYVTFTAQKPYDEEGEIGSFVLTLYNSDGTVVWEADTQPQRDGFSDSYVYKIGLAKGTYFMNLKPNFVVFSDSAPIPSTYKYKFTASNYWEVESNDTPVTATKLDFDKMYSAVFTDQSFNTPYTDYFSASLTKGAKYRVYFDNYFTIKSTTTMIFCILTPSGEEISTNEFTAKQSGTKSYWDFTATETGIYYLKVFNCGHGKGADYQIGIYKRVIDVSQLNVNLTTTSYIYDGKVKTPGVVAKYGNTTLTKNVDYTVTYPSSRTAPGTYSVVVKFKGAYTGSKKLTFKIAPPIDVSKLKVSLTTTSYKYDGKAKTPGVVAKYGNTTLTKNVDYTVTYSSARNKIGIYSVIVKFQGCFTGTKKLTFKIVPPTVSAKMTATQTSSAIKFTWTKVAGATGYRVYQYNPTKKQYVQIAAVAGNSYKITGLKAGSTYFFRVRAYRKLSNGTIIDGGVSKTFTTATKCAGPKITNMYTFSGQEVSLFWAEAKGASGYQVYYSTSKSTGYKCAFTTYNEYSTYGDAVLPKATKGKRVYFKVRAYTKVNGQTIFGNWGAVTSTVIK